MSDKQLTPFSKELWETGEYEAETSSQWTPKIYEITSTHVYGRIFDLLISWDLNGNCQENNQDDLMLRKKTKKVWIPLQEKFVFETKEECEKYFSRLLEPIKAIEVEI